MSITLEKPHSSNGPAAPSYARDPRWLLVERILATPEFERSARLSDFLSHVCRLALEDRSDEISEQSLGEIVFGRKPGYDSSADSIVRSHALRLRHRLEFYFSTDGAIEPLHIEIPRGGYVPRFYTPNVDLPASQDAQPVPIPPTVSSIEASPSMAVHEAPRRENRWLKGLAVGVLLGAMGTLVVFHLRQDARLAASSAEARQPPILRQFWTRLFPANGRTVIVSGDSGLVLFKTVTGSNVNLSDYLNGSYGKVDPNKKFLSGTPGTIAADLASRRYTSIVDLDLATRIAHLPQASSEHAVNIFARDLRPADAARSNLILIGSQEANPWISLIEPSMNFILTRDAQGHGFYFVNRHPRDKELKEYRPTDEPGNLGAQDVYGDVAYLPNPSGNGMILALSGLWMSGTQSAGNFVLDGAKFSEWLKSIANSDGTVPPFELLIETKNLQGNAAYSSVIAQRIAR
jgi:hypothetical protein